MKSSAKKVAVCGLLIAIALVLQFVEKLIPVEFVFYGFKLGLANIVVLFALYKLRFIDSFIICIFKILICGLGFGGPVYLMYSLSGGILSFFAMWLSKQKLNIITVSVLGSVFFNIGQVVCACFMLSTKAILSYLPVLVVAGVFTGALIDIVSDIAIKRIKI
ncbi:MAG: Gx transporter family protein [Clostridia bacterium]|nr:Gx transporter family protein [Clostridia bacterium]